MSGDINIRDTRIYKIFIKSKNKITREEWAVNSAKLRYKGLKSELFCCLNERVIGGKCFQESNGMHAPAHLPT